MDLVSVMMITIPIFFPLIQGLGVNPIWFGILMLLNLEMAPITPPFGMELFVMKGVAPPSVRIGDIYRSAVPFIFLDIAVLAFMLIFPDALLWLPSLTAAK